MNKSTHFLDRLENKGLKFSKTDANKILCSERTLSSVVRDH